MREKKHFVRRTEKKKNVLWVNCVLQKALKEIYTWGENRKKKTKHNRKIKIGLTCPKGEKTKLYQHPSS